MIFGKHINRYYLRYAHVLLLGLATLFLVDYAQMIIPNLFQMVVNGMNRGSVEVDGQLLAFDMDFLFYRICVPMLAVTVCLVFGRFIWRCCFFGSAIRVETDIRNRMFDHARNLSREYYQLNKVGNLMSLFTNDLDTVQDCYGWGIMMFCDALFLVVLSVMRMWGMNRLLTLLTLIPMVLLLGASTVLGRYMMKKWDYRQACFSKLSDFAQESFSGIAVIKAFVKEAKELLAFQKLNVENEKANVEHTKAAVLLKILVNLFVESVVCVILLYGGWLVYVGRFNAGQLVEFIGYFSSVVWPIMAVAELVDMTSRGNASLKRVGEFLDARQTVFDRPEVTEIRDVRGEIEFRHLDFQYPDGNVPALKDITVTIHPGEKIGLVGKTGSGKSTLVDLILRTYNVPDGTLFIDGRDVNTVSIQSLREACAYVPQDNFLFSDTIARNISFGVSEGCRDEIIDAARMADVDGNIQEFHKGYQTVLGERGVTVSGGQKQRISIARALMKKAPILILDDSVSAVDTKTENNILHNLGEVRQGMTTLLIAHRVSTIAKMDRLLFMEDGALTAVGTHQELYASCPSYRKMVDMQRLEEEGGEHND